MIVPEFNLTDKQNQQYAQYFSFLVDYNKKVNLTAITEEKEVYVKHFYDSMLGAQFIKEGAKVVDIGTGAGFPGVPLKIYRPDIKLTLVDSLNKRIVFLEELVKLLEVDANCIHSRAEDFAINNRECFDVVVSRAVASLNTLCEYTLPLVKVGGIFIAYKSGNIQQELETSKKAIQLLGGKINKIEKIKLPQEMGERSLILIEKIKKCSTKYPRGKNLPKLKPII